MDERTNKEVFVELAKVKSQPTPITIEHTDLSPRDEDGEGKLTVDVYQDGDDLVVQSTVAGVKEEDLDINITTESVTISGEREKTQEIQDKDFFYQECFWGRFSRSIILPYEVDPELSHAHLKHGVLTVRMPRLSRAKAKKLKVKSD